MLIAFIVVLLVAAVIVPLIITGDLVAFFKRDAVLWAAAFVALGVAVLLNLVADKKFARIDLTTEKKYSVSNEMKHIMERLGDDEAKITYYVFARTPVFEPYKRDMIDKLNEIKNASNGRVTLDVVDPSGNKKLMEELTQKDYLKQVNVSQKDEMSMSNLISGLQITYKDKPSLDIPVIYNADELEYQLGGRLIELTVSKKHLVAIMAPPAPPAPPPQMQRGQRPPGNGYEWLAQGGIDDKKFEIKNIDISEGNGIPKEAACLIVIRPKELSERQRYEVVKFLAEGGKMLLLAAPFRLYSEMNSWKVDKTPSGLEDYLKECGVAFGQDFIADKSNLQLPQLNMFTGKIETQTIPLFIKIKPENIDQTTSLTRLMPGLVMPFPAEIKLDKDTLSKTGLSEVTLAKTTNQNWTIKFAENFNPVKVGEDEATLPPMEAPKAVFVMLKGKFPFPYDGKPIPEWNKPADKDKEKDAAKDKDKEKEKDKKVETAKAERKEGTLVICSSPDAFLQQYLEDRMLNQQMQGNIALISNITESMSFGDDLMRLRSKRYETRTLAGLAGKEGETKRQYWKAFLIFGIPLIVLIFAIYRFVLRRVRQLSYERNYAGTTGPSSFTA